MATKKFLDQDGLIELLQQIESLDETNVKDLYWSTDNADTYPTVVFKVGDDNGVAHSTKKITFKGDITSPAPAGATARTIKITIGNVDKTITYYDTTDPGAGNVTYSYSSDSNSASAATKVKAALDRIITKVNALKSTDITMNEAIVGSSITTSDTVQSAMVKIDSRVTNIANQLTGQFKVLKSTGDTAEEYTALNNILSALNDDDPSTTPSASDLNKLSLGYIYLLETGTDSNVFDEYVKVETSTNVYTVERVGTTDAGVDVVSIPPTGANSVASLFATYVTNA